MRFPGFRQITHPDVACPERADARLGDDNIVKVDDVPQARMDPGSGTHGAWQVPQLPAGQLLGYFISSLLRGGGGAQ